MYDAVNNCLCAVTKVLQERTAARRLVYVKAIHVRMVGRVSVELAITVANVCQRSLTCDCSAIPLTCMSH